MKTYKITQEDYIKANRKASREEEIRLYGKQIFNRHIVHKSKKKYNRKRDRKVPLFLYKYFCVFTLYLIYINRI
jgi:hypothetical protein